MAFPVKCENKTNATVLKEMYKQVNLLEMVEPPERKKFLKFVNRNLQEKILTGMAKA